MTDPPVPLPRTDCIAERPLAAPVADTRPADEKVFLELRRKVQESELLSAATERLLGKMRFNGRLPWSRGTAASSSLPMRKDTSGEKTTSASASLRCSRPFSGPAAHN